VLEDPERGRTVALAQGVEDLSVRGGREREAAGGSHIGGEVSAGHLSEPHDEFEQPPIGAAGQQHPMPFVLEVEAGSHVAPGVFQRAVELGQVIEAFAREIGGELESQGLQGSEDGADLPDLVAAERAKPEAAPHVGLEHPVAGEAEEGLAHRRPADAELGSESGIADAHTRCEFSAVNAIEEVAVDLVAERDSGNDVGLSSICIHIPYTVFCFCTPSSPGGTMLAARVLPIALCLLAPALHAQSEAALKERLEGRAVTVKLAMPGAEEGVDVYPATDKPLDYPRYASRLKKFGTALHSGQSAMITKIKVKSDHIEFQLDGGGYGTMGDETSSNVNVGSAPKTKRERNLEAELRRATDPARKRAIKEELDELRRDREREDARNRATVAEAEEHKKENIRDRRIEGGSRFNLRYRDGVPESALTAESVMQALAEYVDFGESAVAQVSSPLNSPEVSAPATPASRLPRKGMLLEEADALLGTPRTTSQRAEGKLKVVTRTYAMEGGRVTAEFVEGVLIRYTMSSD
jgi:hypothetical protein